MRTLWIAGMGATLMTAGVADAQRVTQHGPGAGYPMPGRMPMARPLPPVAPHAMSMRPGMRAPARAAHWQMRDGRWVGGWNAPGGWNAYRRPYVGWALPRYWVQPSFAIVNWSGYGLASPPYGYSWSRYYDDAVLIDARGSVRDMVSGIDWDGYDGARYAEEVPIAPDYARRDDGLGGAAIGAVAGGVAGNVIAGRGNRLGGTLVGAGVGAAAGYVIDRAEDGPRRVPPPPPHGAGFPPPPPHGMGYPPPPPHVYAPYGPGTWVSPDGRTTVTTTGGGYYGGSTTTVVVQAAPVVTTTTTTEYYDDTVTYSRPVKRKVHRKVYRRPAKPSKTICRC